MVVCTKINLGWKGLTQLLNLYVLTITRYCDLLYPFLRNLFTNLQICRFISLLSFLLRQPPFLLGNETLFNKLRRKENTSAHDPS